jgi:hypothetical protein
MDDAELIKIIRNVCGDWITDNYYVPYEDGVPIFVGESHDATVPEVLIRPFIDSKFILNEVSIFDDAATPTKEFLTYKSIDFQIDVYGSTISEVIDIKNLIERRITGFNEVDLVAYNDPFNWESYESVTYVSEEYDSTCQILSICEPGHMYSREDSISGVIAENGSWFLDDSGLYVNPLTSLDDMIIREVINGLAFIDGDTLYDKKVNGIILRSSQRSRDKNPKLERWMLELTVNYMEINSIPAGPKVEEFDINVQES